VITQDWYKKPELDSVLIPVLATIGAQRLESFVR